MKNELYCVLSINGMIGQSVWVVSENISRDEAVNMAKRMRRYLTRADREYYHSTYKAMPMSKIRTGKYAALLGRI